MADTRAGDGGASADAHLVLVVDDIEDNRFLYRTGFEKAGFRVDEAEDGDAALAKVARVRPAAIVMDLTMPNLDGWTATQRIKENPATKDILVIVVTGSSTPPEIERAWAAGADEICAKPCTATALVGLVRRLLETKTANSA